MIKDRPMRSTPTTLNKNEDVSALSFFGTLAAYRLMAVLCFLCILMNALEFRKTGQFDGLGLVLVGAMFALGYLCAKKSSRQNK